MICLHAIGKFDSLRFPLSPYMATPKKKIILVSNDMFLSSQILSLADDGFDIHWEKRITNAAAAVDAMEPQLILLDTENHRELATLEFCFYIKSNPKFNACRIFILSDHREEFAEIAAFDAGADDFVTKPIRIKSFSRRIKARIENSNKNILIQGDTTGNTSVKIDPESYSVFLGTNAVHVSRKEFELLYLMASRPGKIFNRNELYEQIWKKKYSYRDRTVDVHILRLRRKLGKEYIQTQKGVGYRFFSS
jgi:two-component system alkaline phosphatase synthesis response regulator PhoP